MRVKKLLVVVVAVMVVVMAGCATLSLPDDATPEQQQAARCFDAQQGLAMAQIALETAIEPEQAAYWQKWALGAQRIINLYCATSVK